MKRLTTVALGLLVLAACQDSTMPVPDGPDIGQPNISITDAGASYGFVDGFFSFLSPLVDNPSVLGTRLNTNLMPKIELWQRDQLDFENLGTDHACEAKQGGTGPMATFIPTVNSDSTYYVYGWKTSDQGLTTGTDYRLCVKVWLANGPKVVGWRDVRPDKTNDPNNPSGTPYLFQNGSNVPIKFWISGKSLCYDAGGNVIDCTIATFDFNGGTAYCDAAQCGIYVPQGVIPSGGELATFIVKYVTCGDESAAGTVDYLEKLDIPQYPGCLEVTTYASYDVSGGFGAGDFAGITTAACRDKSMLGPQDERLLLHLESPDDPNTIYALPTRPFDLDCGPITVAKAPGADGSIGDWARYYAARGAQALERTILPLLNPPELNAAHAGFGGGTSLTCSGASVSTADGNSPVTSCSTPSLVTGNSPSAAPAIEPGTPVTFRMVWALPSKIVARYQVTSLGPPITATNWIDPVSAPPNGLLRPAVKVTDECKPDADPYTLPDGTVQYETCGDPSDVPRPVEGARVTFEFPNGATHQVPTNTDGIAYAPWTVPTTAGLYTATASGLGIGVDPTLASVTMSPPPAAGTYQDHVGNNAVLLQAPKVKFDVSVCSNKSGVLSEPGVESDYGDPYKIPINISSSAADTAYFYVTSDCHNAYFALKIPNAADLQNSLRIVFVDSDSANGTLPAAWDPSDPDAWFASIPEVGDDMWKIYQNLDKKAGADYLKWHIEDWHVSDDCTGSSKQSECGALDDPMHPMGDLIPATNGVVWVDPSDGTFYFEFARSFDHNDPLDFYVPSTGGQTRIAFYFVLQQKGAKGTQGDTEYPDFRVFQPVLIKVQ